jgi:hypothetical protein
VSLSSDLISQFVKATKDTTKAKTETTVYGTIVYDGKPYVKIDGSDLLTPVITTTDVEDGERVTVRIDNHTATVTGNISSPAARTDAVKDVASQISEFEIIIAHRVTTEELEAANAVIENLKATVARIGSLETINADIENLQAKFANLDYVTATDVTAINAEIESLRAKFGDFTDISTEDLEAINADITTLRGYTADFTYVSTDVLEAIKANIQELDTNKLSAETANILYANIDFSNIEMAAVEKLFTTSGIIKDLVVDDQHISGELVGVTIKGDLIEANTLKAEKLVVKGSDGLFYKLNFDAGNFVDGEAIPDDSIHGSILTAKSVTAEKVVVEDLVAFGATIGGFHISDESIFSGAKESVDNTTNGIYMDKDGQISIGDGFNFIKYYKGDDGKYKLEVSAGSIMFGANNKPIEDAIADEVSKIEIGARNLIRNSKTLMFTDYYFSGPIIITYDGVGTVEVICGGSATILSDGNVNFRTSAIVSDDGSGNVVIT